MPRCENHGRNRVFDVPLYKTSKLLSYFTYMYINIIGYFLINQAQFEVSSFDASHELFSFLLVKKKTFIFRGPEVYVLDAEFV